MHLSRFNPTKEEREGPNPLGRTKKEKQQMWSDLCMKGPKIIIDCDYEELMLEKEIKSLTQQLTFCVNINKKLEMPMNLIFTGVGPTAHKQLSMAQYANW
jgi:tRNA (guanine9-N1)-methyltransferase